jgi:hypothetical protein
VCALNKSTSIHVSYNYYIPKKYTGGETYALIYNRMIININEIASDYIPLYKETKFKQNFSARLPFRFRLKFLHSTNILDVIAWHAPYSDKEMRLKGLESLKTSIIESRLHDVPCVIAADFNCTNDEQLSIVKSMEPSSTELVSMSKPTNFGKKAHYYDHVFLLSISGKDTNIKFSSDTSNSRPVSGNMAKDYSDHCPVYSQYTVSGCQITPIDDIEHPIDNIPQSQLLEKLNSLYVTALQSLGLKRDFTASTFSKRKKH